ncbi:MAG: hypothetical protein EON57_13990, partial [Alphaproteobacteria bacterium]
MAKKPSPQNDPATLAFSAVEDALKDSVFAGLDQPAAAEQPAERPAPSLGPKPVQRESSPRTERQRTADKFAAQTGSVANDDRFQSTKILYGLQQKPAGNTTMVAALVSLGWVVAIALVAVVRNGSDLGTPAFWGSNDFIGLLALAIVPVIGIFAVATLIRRAQDLRNAAAAVTQAA